MTESNLIDRYFDFDDYEKLGKKHYQATGEEMRYEEYLYLLKHGLSQASLKSLHEPAARREQEQLARDFHDRYHESGLTEQDFLLPGSNVDVERLLRYIRLPEHSHLFVEMAYVFEGKCHHFVEGQEYLQEEGELIVLPPGTHHDLSAENDARCITVKLQLDFFVHLSIPELPMYSRPLRFSCGKDPMLEAMFLFLFQQQETQLPYRNQMMENTIINILTYVMQQYKDSLTILTQTPVMDKTVLEMITYMYENYQTVTLTSLAEQFHYNESYLSRMFHDQTGKTFSQALKEYRLSKAEELLLTTDWKLDRICDKIGYKDTRQFIRSFRELYGDTPEKYRKKKQSFSA